MSTLLQCISKHIKDIFPVQNKSYKQKVLENSDLMNYDFNDDNEDDNDDDNCNKMSLYQFIIPFFG